jgi:hypothetical protein
VQHAKAPGSVQWEPGEVEEINLIQVCIILGQPSYAVEQMNARHVALVLEIDRANKQIEAERIKAARKKRGK